MKKLFVSLLICLLLFTSCAAFDDILGGSSVEQSSSIDISTSSEYEESSYDSSSIKDSQPEDPTVDSSISDSTDSSEEEPTQPDSSEEPTTPDSSEPSQPTPPTVEHSYEATVTPPTCEADGYTTYFCAHCGDSYVADEVDKLEHDEQTVAGYEATCTKPGLTDGTECSICGDPIIEQAVIQPLKHNYEKSVTEPTCSTSGYTTYTCSRCNDSYIADEVVTLGHNEIDVAGYAATCTKPGLTDGIECSVCGETLTAQTEIPKLGHSYTPSVTSPTCVDIGYTTYTCSTCRYSYISNYTSALGHRWIPATTEAPKTCSTCGETEGEKLPTPSEPSTPDTPSGYSKTLSVNYIDVGQGDSIFLQVGDCDILIDGGKPDKGSIVSSYLRNKGVDDIELMINTHPDDDHYGGLTTVLGDFKVEEVWCSAYAKSNSSYNKFKNAVANEGLAFKTPAVGDVYTYEYLTLTVLYAGKNASSSNDSSLVVLVQYGSFRFLFTGDISNTVEKQLVNNNVDLRCDVLKVAHHGSASSSASVFLKATGAKYGVICVGADNGYGHPTSTALNNLSVAGISVYRTDKNAHVVFSTNGESLTLPNGSTATKSARNLATLVGTQRLLSPSLSNSIPSISKRKYYGNRTAIYTTDIRFIRFA